MLQVEAALAKQGLPTQTQVSTINDKADESHYKDDSPSPKGKSQEG